MNFKLVLFHANFFSFYFIYIFSLHTDIISILTLSTVCYCRPPPFIATIHHHSSLPSTIICCRLPPGLPSIVADRYRLPSSAATNCCRQPHCRAPSAVASHHHYPPLLCRRRPLWLAVDGHIVHHYLSPSIVAACLVCHHLLMLATTIFHRLPSLATTFR